MTFIPHRFQIMFLALLLAAPATHAATLGTLKAEAPAAAQPATHEANYLLRPGDMLHINVWKEEELDRELQILPDGTVDFPLIGSFTAAGLTTSAVRDLVKQKLVPFIPSATVTVMVKEARGNSISVMGQVAKPGEIIMTRQMNVLQALSQVGGLTTYADDDDIVILRRVDGKETSIPFDYGAVAAGRKLESNIALEPGDVIVVPTASLF